MDRSALKKYAPQARRDFIAAITDRAGFYGLTKKHIEPVKIEGSVALIGGRPFDRSVAFKRNNLERQIAQQGFDQVMESIAYTWFNRFVALRYMELHGYLDHGYRVLSHPEGKDLPEIVEQAHHVFLPGLNPQRVIDLKLAGDQENQLYRILLVAQCNALHKAMPFLFERIDDATELLLPENLLHSDSLVRKLVREVPEEHWQEIEVIGWIYQFYISEKKDQVIGKVVKSEDIPAATQLFTPNWIVKYLVQNSIGRQWLATYPDSPLRQQMEYYIEPAEQTPEVQAQLKAITPESLNPEEMTLLDPASGSGHILVEAYDLFKAIYQERGYRAKDIPRLILRNNLFGLEIDERAAQLAAFALLMKARADDRRVLEGGIRMNVRCIQSSDGIKAEEVYEALSSLTPNHYPLAPDSCPSHQPLATLNDIRVVLTLFRGEDAKTLGSLIRIPLRLEEKLQGIVERVDELVHGEDLNRRSVAERFALIGEQAWILGRRYDAVVTNPPYMGNGYFPPYLRQHINTYYSIGKEDLYGCFIIRSLSLATTSGRVGMITIPNWMFLSSYQALRNALLCSQAIATLIHNGRGVWGSDFGSSSFVIHNAPLQSFAGSYKRLFDNKGSVATNEELERRFFNKDVFHVPGQCFLNVPNNPIAYWVGQAVLRHFSGAKKVKDIGEARRGLQTGNSLRFIRFWYEVDAECTLLETVNPAESHSSRAKWVLFNNGGDFRKWYGNVEQTVNWKDNGREIKESGKAIIPSEHHYFKEAISWSRVSAGKTAFRFVRAGILPGDSGPCIFESASKLPLLAYLNSAVARTFLEVFVPTLTFLTGDVDNLPVLELDDKGCRETLEANAQKCIAISMDDWNSRETSWGFRKHPLLYGCAKRETLDSSWQRWRMYKESAINDVQEMEEENNRLLAGVFELEEVINSYVAPEEITLYRADREQDVRRFLSYAIGCMMGRYSLDEPGLIYAHSGNEAFDPSRYTTFPADPDGIIPLTDLDWFPDDAANRFAEFVGIAWPGNQGTGGREQGSESQGTGSTEQGVGEEKEEEEYGRDSELSGLGGLAEGDGRGGVGLHTNEAVPEGGGVRTEQPIAAGGGVDAIEHRGGSRKKVTGGVSQFPLDHTGKPGGSGDPASAGKSSGLPIGGGNSPGTLSTQRNQPDDLFNSQQAEDSLTPVPCPLSPSALLEENLQFVAEGLGQKKDEDARATIRRYFATGFFKDHLQTYKRRPIYWLFTSGKERAFQGLVYLHRYNEGTLARMRTEYVIPLQGKVASRIEHLKNDIAAATSTAHGRKLQKEHDTLKKHLEELRTFDEKLNHHAAQRITLDLDDGVKVNYGKFGDLLAEVKAVTGGKVEEE